MLGVLWKSASLCAYGPWLVCENVLDSSLHLFRLPCMMKNHSFNHFQV